MWYYFYREKNFANNPCQSGSSHVNLNWLILLQANLRPYGNHFFSVNVGSN